MNESQVIAQVESVNPMFAELRPAFRISESGDWESITTAAQDFPDRGSVIWFHRLKKPTSGSVWKVETEFCPTYNGSTKQDRFRTKIGSAHELFEVIDLTQFGEAGHIQEQLVGPGLSLGNRNVSAVVLRISETDFVGPVELEMDRGNYRLSDGQDRTRIPYHELSESDLVFPSGLLNGRIFIQDSNRLKAPSRIETWESDVELLRKIAHRLRKLDQRKYNELGITYKVFDAYIDAIESAQMTPELRELERSRARRLSRIKENIEFDRQLLQDAAAFLKKQPSVEQELQESLAAEKDRVRKDMEAELRDSKIQLAKIRKEAESLQKEQDAKAVEIARQVGDLEDSIQERLLAAIEQPAECLTDIAIFNAVFQQIGMARHKPRSLVTEIPSLSPPNTVVKTDEELADLLGKNLAKVDADLTIGKQLHAAFISGQIPLLMGTRAIAALKAYDQSVGNGLAMWFPVSTRTVTTADILQVDEFANWLEQALSTDSIRLLILDGANNAGAESALTPLACCYSEAWLNSQLRRLTFQIGQELKRLAWPKNILVAAIANTGATTLPLPAEFWDHAMPIGCNPKQRYFANESLHPFERDAGLSTGQVHLATWSKWRSRVATQCFQPMETVLGKFESKQSLSRELRDQTVCFFSALRSQGVDEKNSIELATLSCILPYLYHDEAALRELLEGIGFDEGYVNGAAAGCKIMSELHLK